METVAVLKNATTVEILKPSSECKYKRLSTYHPTSRSMFKAM